MLQKVSSPSRTKKPKGALEKAVKSVVKRVLNDWGAYWFMSVPSGIGKSTVDFIACVPVMITQDMVGKRVGIFVGIETKRESVSEVTPRQQQILESMMDAGGAAVVIHDVSEFIVEDDIIAAVKRGLGSSGRWVHI